jgi:hypothetical protein
MCGGRNIAGGRSKAMTSIDPKLRKALTGISGILVTPFDQEDKLLFLRNDGIGLDAIEQLCRIEGVAGVKWAAPTPLRLAEAIRRGDPDIVWVGGLVEIWAPPLCAVGARGFTSGLINVWPEHSVAIHAALEGGDYARANRLIGVMSRNTRRRAERHQRDGSKGSAAVDGRRLQTDAAAISLAIHREPVGGPPGPSDLMEAHATPSDRRTQTGHQLASQLT